MSGSVTPGLVYNNGLLLFNKIYITNRNTVGDLEIIITNMI